MDMACALTSDGCFDVEEVAARYGGLSSRLEAVLSHLVETGVLHRAGSVLSALPGPENPLASTVRTLAYECRPTDRGRRRDGPGGNPSPSCVPKKGDY